MDTITLYTWLLLAIGCATSIVDHTDDYLWSFKTYHFEWNEQHFSVQPNTNTNSNTITACTHKLPSLCIEHTPNTPGFTLTYNNSAFNFEHDHEWSQINYLHANHSITLYDPTYSPLNNAVYNLDDLTYNFDFDDEDDEAETTDNLPRRLLRRNKSVSPFTHTHTPSPSPAPQLGRLRRQRHRQRHRRL